MTWRKRSLRTTLVPAIAPEYVAFVDSGGNSTNFRDTPEWGSASILSPWEAYRTYGNADILRDHYDSLVRYAGYLRSKLKDGMLSYGLGDWFDIGPGRPGEAQLREGDTATAIYYQDLRTLAAIASLLGKEADATTLPKRLRTFESPSIAISSILTQRPTIAGARPRRPCRWSLALFQRIFAKLCLRI